MQCAGVAAGMDHVGPVVGGFGFHPFGEGAGAVVEVPVEAFGEAQALGGLQADGVDVAEEHQQGGDLHLAVEAEFGGLLDAGGGVGAGVGEAEDLGAAGLGGDQVGGEVAGAREGIGARAFHLAAGGGDEAGGVLLQALAEDVVGGDEVPAGAAGPHGGAGGGLGQHVGVVGPVQRVGRALRAGEVGGAGAGVDEDLVLLFRHAGDGEGDRGGGDVEDDVDAVAVEPLAGDAGADVGLVLVVGGDHFDIEAMAAEVLHGLLGADHRGLAADLAIGAGHVGEDPELDRTCRLRAGHRRHSGEGGGGAEQTAAADRCVHVALPWFRRRDRRAVCPCCWRGRHWGSCR